MIPQFTLNQFSGPLDLLLSLLSEQKLTINEIAIAQVTEQFLRYLDTLEEHRAEELADFLVVATRLLLLKSRTLLPQFASTEDEGPSLADQLRLYQQFVAVARQVNKLWIDSNRAAFRFEPPRHPTEFVLPSNVTLDALRMHMVQLVTRLTPPKALPELKIDKAISLKQKIDHIRNLLKQAARFSFHELVSTAGNRTEVIVSFLALLELVKEKMIVVKQEEQFGEIVVEKI